MYVYTYINKTSFACTNASACQRPDTYAKVSQVHHAKLIRLFASSQADPSVCIKPS